MSTLHQTRPYVVVATDTGAERLIDAPTKSRAVRLAVTARVATPHDIVRLMAAGVKAETEMPKPKSPSRPKLSAQRRA
jgi:hypothetical protein